MKALLVSLAMLLSSYTTLAQSHSDDTSPATLPMSTPYKELKSKKLTPPKKKGQSDSGRSDLDHSTESPLANPSHQPVIDQH